MPLATGIESPVIETLVGAPADVDVISAVTPIGVVPLYRFAVNLVPEPLFSYAEKVMLVITRLLPGAGVIGNSR